MLSNIDPAVLIMNDKMNFFMKITLKIFFSLIWNSNLLCLRTYQPNVVDKVIVCEIQPSHSLRLQQRATITELDFLFLSRWQ